MINWKVRIKNPYFWLGIVGVLFTAMGINYEALTTWDILIQHFKQLIGNPYMIFSIILSVIGVINDPTTVGLKDSENALNYTEPKK